MIFISLLTFLYFGNGTSIYNPPQVFTIHLTKLILATKTLFNLLLPLVNEDLQSTTTKFITSLPVLRRVSTRVRLGTLGIYIIQCTDFPKRISISILMTGIKKHNNVVLRCLTHYICVILEKRVSKPP